MPFFTSALLAYLRFLTVLTCMPPHSPENSSACHAHVYFLRNVHIFGVAVVRVCKQHQLRKPIGLIISSPWSVAYCRLTSHRDSSWQQVIACVSSILAFGLYVLALSKLTKPGQTAASSAGFDFPASLSRNSSPSIAGV
jgi:hypothetical protein